MFTLLSSSPQKSSRNHSCRLPFITSSFPKILKSPVTTVAYALILLALAGELLFIIRSCVGGVGWEDGQAHNITTYAFGSISFKPGIFS